MILFYLVIFIVSCVFLVYSGTWIVKALAGIAQFLGWKEFIVASVLMAFATSLPEIFIGITSALQHKPELSFGNVIGSNIIALTLVVGVGAIVAKGLKMEGRILQRSSIYAVVIALLPFLLMLDGNISRIDGVVLILASMLYFHIILSREERFTKVFSDHFRKDWTHFKIFLRNLGIFSGGVALLLLSSEGIVFSASNLSVEMNFSLLFLGIFLIALGTSIPELAFGVRSVTMNHKEMIIGGAIGSVVINSSLALGLVAIICPFKISIFSQYLVGAIFTVITALFFLIFARTNREITRREALFLLNIYAAFVLIEFLVK